RRNGKVRNREGQSETSGESSRITYDDIALNCFRYLGLKSFEEVDDLLLDEYLLLMKAFNLKRVDTEYDYHLQAWLSQQVQSTEQQCKNSVPVYKKFKDFYHYEERVNDILKPEPKQVKRTRIELLLLKANS